MKLIKAFVQIVFFLLPWSIRRLLLVHLFGFDLHKNCKIGFSIVLAKRVKLEEEAIIQNANFINSIDTLELAPYAKIGSYNWITGISSSSSAYKATPDRECIFRLGKHTRITDRHYFDCNGGITIGTFTTVAGLSSQFISHGINILENQQEAHPIKIGNFCMLGSGVKVLKNSVLPDKSILGAGAILNKAYEEPYGVFVGVPAKRVKDLSKGAKYFLRTGGPVK